MTGWRLGYVIAPPSSCARSSAAHGKLLHLDQRVRAVGGARRASARLAPRRGALPPDLRRAPAGDGGRAPAHGLGVGAPPTGAFYVARQRSAATPPTRRLRVRAPRARPRRGDAGVDFGANAEGYLRFCLRQVARAYRGGARAASAASSARARGAMSDAGLRDVRAWSAKAESTSSPTWPTAAPYLNEDQFFPGWVFVVLAPARQRALRADPRRARALIEDVSRVAQALAARISPVKMNYELPRQPGAAHPLAPGAAPDPAPPRAHLDGRARWWPPPRGGRASGSPSIRRGSCLSGWTRPFYAAVHAEDATAPTGGSSGGARGHPRRRWPRRLARAAARAWPSFGRGSGGMCWRRSAASGPRWAWEMDAALRARVRRGPRRAAGASAGHGSRAGARALGSQVSCLFDVLEHRGRRGRARPPRAGGSCRRPAS